MTKKLLKNIINNFSYLERTFMDGDEVILMECNNENWAVIFWDNKGIQINYDETDRSGCFGHYIECKLDDFSTFNIINIIKKYL